MASPSAHKGFQQGEVPEYEDCECGQRVRIDRLDLIEEHELVCPAKKHTWSDSRTDAEVRDALAARGIELEDRPERPARKMLDRRHPYSRPVAELIAAAGAPLTLREVDVLRLFAEGHTVEEVADNLYIGKETVKTHLRNAYVKLGARHRAHAVALCYERGYLRLGELRSLEP